MSCLALEAQLCPNVWLLCIALGCCPARYAAALRLDDRHSLALVKESVVRNKHVGNYQ
jgi:hypothetical protein